MRPAPPGSLRADPGFECHRVAHEATDAPIPVQEGVDGFEAVMGCGDRHDPAAGAEPGKSVARLEMRHEGFHHRGRGRQVTADRNLLIFPSAEFPWGHAHLAPCPFDQEHCLRGILIEGTVQPPDEGGRGWFRQLAGGMLPVDRALQTDMRPGFDLEVATLFRRRQVAGERALDLARRRVVALDQVRIVAVHHPHQIGEAGGRAWVQTPAERLCRTRQRGDQIEDFGARFVEEAGFNA
jgi:hypothetical protein